MNLLALDASTEMASVAVLAGKNIFSEEQGSQKTHAQLLLPMIDRLLAQAGLQSHQLDGIVFGCGPGSFTGLRIACSIAKGFAYAHNLPLIPVSCLGAIAYAARDISEYKHSAILAVVDARMQEMYWSYFPQDEFVAVDNVNAVKDIALPEDQEIILAGVGIDLYWADFSEQLRSQVRAQLTLYPNAADMIRLAQSAAIKPVSVSEAQPVYVRNQVTQGASRG